MVLIFDAEQYLTGDRAEALRSVLVPVTAPHRIWFLGNATAARTRITAWKLDDDVTLLRHESTGIAHARTAKERRLVGPERVAFVVHDAEAGHYEHVDIRRPLIRGSLSVTDLNAEYAYSRPGAGVSHIIQIERSRLDVPLETVHLADSRLAASPFYELVRQHIVTASKAAARIVDAKEGPSLSEATTQLLRALLVTAAHDEGACVRQAMHDQLLDRIGLYIQLHFRDRELTPDQIASEHSLSTRYLFHLWSGQPLSLLETIFHLRLDAAQRQLLSEPLAPVAKVARECGFVDASHFSRRFRQKFGCSPSEWRRQLPPTATSRTARPEQGPPA
jgi:AraC-like DNA-binding protein